jgi:hypothetical protein
MRRPLLFLACLALATGTAFARDIYVSSETGKNDNPGTKEAPKKLLWKVMGELSPGDHVFVAEGRQEGQSKSGLMPKCAVSKVTIEGGWKKDFSERDPFKYLTIIGPPDDVQGATGSVFHFESPDGKLTEVTIDGFAIDGGQRSYYYSTGEPGAEKAIEGHFDCTAWGYREINRKMSGSDPTVVLIGRGSFTVRNMLLINNPWWGIYVKCGGPGTTTIENNLVLISQGRGIEAIVGGGWGAATIVLRNNTVAFNHTMKTTEGRALSIDPREGKYVVENNVCCFSDGAGVDTKFGAKGDALLLKDNLFFFNRRGDFAVGDSGVANCGSFDDELECKHSGNVHEMPKFLSKIAKEWFDRYSSREYVDMLAGNFNKEEELVAARAVFGLKEYVLPGYKETFPSYKALPQKRNNYDMSRYPHPMKKGEALDWTQAVLPIVGADGPRGIQPYKAGM